MDTSEIGCTLAEAAESEGYLKWLEGSGEQAERNLHVVYINTSLRTKAQSQYRVPTITCTSSNVVKTVLQAFAQVRRSIYKSILFLAPHISPLFGGVGGHGNPCITAAYSFRGSRSNHEQHAACCRV